MRAIYGAVAAALPNLAYSRNQPALLPNRSPGIRPPPPEQWGTDAAYLEEATGRLGQAASGWPRCGAPGARATAIERRLANWPTRSRARRPAWLSAWRSGAR